MQKNDLVSGAAPALIVGIDVDHPPAGPVNAVSWHQINPPITPDRLGPCQHDCRQQIAGGGLDPVIFNQRHKPRRSDAQQNCHDRQRNQHLCQAVSRDPSKSS